jgi:hypothetical protein
MNLKNRNDNRRVFVPVYDYHPALVITKALNEIMDTNLFTVQVLGACGSGAGHNI